MKLVKMFYTNHIFPAFKANHENCIFSMAEAMIRVKFFKKYTLNYQRNGIRER